jgi:glycosyltransferase involved in cell wall biosynthesis
VKILLVTPYFQDSFAGKISIGSAVMAARQLSRRHHVTVLTTGRSIPVERVSPTLTVVSAPGLLLPDPVNYVIAPAVLWRAARFILRERPEVVLVSKFMFFTCLSALVARLLGTPAIFITDNYPGIDYFSRSRLVAAVMWLYARVIGVPLLRSGRRIVLLHEGLVPIARRYGLEPEVIPNGVELADADAASPAPDLVKPEGEVWIAYVGRLESVKGPDFLLQAARPLLARRRGLRLVFVGAARPGALPADPAIRHLGFRRDVYAVLRHVDIFCLPSVYEGLPNALMEAMAVGCACVATRVGGVPSLIEDGINGLLVEPADVAGLEKALDRLADDAVLRARLGRAARQTIEARFDARRLADRYDALFESVLGRRPEPSLASASAPGLRD